MPNNPQNIAVKNWIPVAHSTLGHSAQKKIKIPKYPEYCLRGLQVYNLLFFWTIYFSFIISIFFCIIDIHFLKQNLNIEFNQPP